MGAAIGLLETKSIPVGLQAADTMLKSASVTLLQALPTCPGKYVVIISGDVAAVKSAMASGAASAGSYLMTQHIINRVHSSVPAAIIGTAEVAQIGAVGMLETISALIAVQAGDIAAKAANVSLMEIRIARGLGGKGYLLLTGDVGAVEAALKACCEALETTGEITSTCVIPSPHPDLIDHLR